MRTVIFSLLSLSVSVATLGQQAFPASEYLDLLDLSLTTHTHDTSKQLTQRGRTQKYERLYRSPEIGLMNRWELWMREDGTAVISLRGTVMAAPSWMENFYAGMIPATGSLKINDSTTFNYRLARDEGAGVHAGWTIGLAHLGPDIVSKMQALIREKGTRRYIIFGHSQGGALAYLTTSYLHYLREDGKLPADVELRTYASAPPKPGNMQYVYDYDFITRNGKGWSVVNSVDWVPETPGTVQTFNDMNAGNPLADAGAIIGKQKWPKNWVLKSVYGKLKKAPEKTLKTFNKNFGSRIHSLLKKNLPGLEEPEYMKSSNYMRAGNPVVLVPDEEYRKKFTDEPGKYFTHHLFAPYEFLVRRYYPVAGGGGTTQK